MVKEEIKEEVKSDNVEKKEDLNESVNEDNTASIDEDTAEVVNEVDNDGEQEETSVEDDSGNDVELTKEEITELIKKARERDEYLDKMQRTRAEYLNFQKRKEKESQDLRRFAVQGLVVELTSILDNFERAIQSTKESKDFDKLLEGIQLVEGQFSKTLEGCGVKPIETAGVPFDPVMHEAVMEEEDNKQLHHTVTLILQKGFLLNDRVIRPAKVKVSKRTDGEVEDDKPEDKEVEEVDNETKESSE